MPATSTTGFIIYFVITEEFSFTLYSMENGKSLNSQSTLQRVSTVA